MSTNDTILNESNALFDSLLHYSSIEKLLIPIPVFSNDTDGITMTCKSRPLISSHDRTSFLKWCNDMTHHKLFNIVPTQFNKLPKHVRNATRADVIIMSDMVESAYGKVETVYKTLWKIINDTIEQSPTQFLGRLILQRDVTKFYEWCVQSKTYGKLLNVQMKLNNTVEHKLQKRTRNLSKVGIPVEINTSDAVIIANDIVCANDPTVMINNAFQCAVM
jgi:hypothetical protein